MPREKVPPKDFVKEKIFFTTKTRRGKEKVILRTPSPTHTPISSPQKGLSQSPSKRQRIGDYDMEMDGNASSEP